MDLHGCIFDIARFALHDGTGIRTTVFFQGCPLSCFWCHNPEGRAIPDECRPAEPSHGDPPTAGRAETPPAPRTRRVRVGDVLAEIERDRLFYEESGGGVTFSGGEPLLQLDFLLELAGQCRRKSIHTTLDTAGYLEPERFVPLVERFDLFLYDLKHVDEAPHLEHTGVSNRWILENLRCLDRSAAPTILRFPLLPGLNDDVGHLKRLSEALSGLRRIRRLSILPYHRLGHHKVRSLGITDYALLLPEPGPEDLERARKLLEAGGLSVEIGA